MNDKTLVTAFMFSELEMQVAQQEAEFLSVTGIRMPMSLYELCGLGAVEVCRNLESIVDDMLNSYDPSLLSFCDLLYSSCNEVAVALYKFMYKYGFMPTSLYALELSKCQTLK